MVTASLKVPKDHYLVSFYWYPHLSFRLIQLLFRTDSHDEGKTIDPQLLASTAAASPQSGISSSSIMASPLAPPPRLILPAPEPCSDAPRRSPLLYPFILCNPDPPPATSPANVSQSNPTISQPNVPQPSASVSQSNPPNPPNTSNASNTSNTSNLTPTTPTLNPTISVFPILNYGSQRRTAEQRAASLRADRLISAVEPTRVFCTVCNKWVQLRRDSSYCSYPWVQHRRKCLARALVFLFRCVGFGFDIEFCYVGNNDL
jgi:hypothetical protein